MTPHKRLGQSQLAPQFAHFILEELTQWLDQVHIHAFGQSANIMVALDRDAWPAGEADTFDHIGVERALREEIGAADLFGLGFEQVNKSAADEFALFLRISDTRQPGKEGLLRIDRDQRDVVMVAEQGDDLLGLIQAHQAMIDIDAGELVADRFVDQHRSDRRIDPAGQAADHSAIPHLVADFGNLGLAEFGHGPIALEPADMAHKIGE